MESDKQKIISKAGNVLILVIAKTASQTSVYKPLVSKSKLTEIFDYVQSLCSPFVRLTVMNPLFEEINIECLVTFQQHIKDEAFYEKQLETDIKRFLSPWAFEDAREPEFGGTIYKAALLNFIEELYYIDFVEKLDIRHQQSVSGDMAIASSPASILISAEEHKITGHLISNNNSTKNEQTIAFC